MADNRTHAEMAAEDPELMRLWGEINNAWDDIERLLYTAFDSLLIDTDSFATQAIFYSQKSHAARRDMVESLAKATLLMRPQIYKKLKGAIARAKSRMNDRHKLAHGMWGISADLKTGETGLARIPPSHDALKPEKPYTRARLKRVRDEMRDTVSALRQAIDPLWDEKRANVLEIHSRQMKRLGLPHSLENTDNS